MMKKEDKYKLLFDNAPIPYQSLNIRGEILDVNRAWLDALGYKYDEVIGNWFGNFLHPDLIDVFKEIFPVNCKRKDLIKDVEFQLRKRDGSFIKVDYTANIGRDDKGNFVRTHCIFKDITEAKRIEKSLKEQESNMRSIFNAMDDIVIEIDANGKIITVAPTSTKYLFRPPEEIIGKNLNEIFPDQIAKKFIDFVQNCLKKENFQTLEYPLEIDNRTMWFEGRGIPVKKDSVIFIARDITERKLYEQELKESKEQYEFLSKSTFEGIVVHSYGIVLDCNQSFLKITGYKMQEVIGENLLDYIPNEKDKKRIIENIKLYNTNPYTIILKRKNGEEFIAELEAKNVKRDGKTVRIVAVRDVTEREKREEMVRNVMDHSTNMFYSHTTDHRLTFVSPQVQEILGCTVEEALTKWTEFATDHPVNEIAFQHTMKAIETGEPQPTYDLQLQRVDGRKIWVEVRETPVIKDGKVVGIAGSLNDVTNKRKAEAELIKAKERAEESDRLKSAFLANMSHEIRTPMNGILGFTELLKEPGLSGETQKKYIDIIQKGGDRMLTTINNIIEISKIETGQVEVVKSMVNVNEVIRHHYDFFLPEAKSKGLEFTYQSSLPDLESIIETDKSLLDSVLSNLIKNAIKYTSKGTVEFGFSQEKDMLKFFVKDSGIGIADDDKKLVFERFIQSGSKKNQVFEGSGLGLPISKAYVELLDGEIWFETSENKGSTFYFTMPYKRPDNIQDKAVTEDVILNKTALKDYTVLITEDDPVADTLLTEILKPHVKTILHAKTGKEALKLFSENNVDLILMDIKIPGSNGLEITRKIREKDKNVKIVAQTAYAMMDDREKALDAGCDNYISKPIKKDDLLKLINDIV